MFWFALVGEAEAKKPPKAPSWGVGGHIGTWAIPGQYPSVLPKVDPDGDGEKTPMESVSKVRGDFVFGAEGWYWVDPKFRLGLLPGMDVGSKYTEAHALLLGDFFFVDGENLDVFAGGGIGVATATFKGTEGEEKLTVPQYPLRAELGGILAVTEQLAPQLRIVGQWNIPASHRYTSVAGAELDKKAVGTGVYVALGIEASFLFGSFH